MVRDCANDPSPDKKWVMFDGPVDGAFGPHPTSFPLSTLLSHTGFCNMTQWQVRMHNPINTEMY